MSTPHPLFVMRKQLPYEPGESGEGRCLAQRRCGGEAQGELHWIIDVPALLPREVGSLVVRYQSGSGGTSGCLASSPALRVARHSDGSASDSSEDESLLLLHHAAHPIHPSLSCSRLLCFTLANFSAQGLRRGIFFQPDPYVKLRVLPGESQALLPHHGQESRSSVVENTVNPTWKRQEFPLVAYPNDVVEIELKDKFAKSRPIMSRFLGRLTIQVASLRDKSSGSGGQLDFALSSKSAGEAVSGHVFFTADFPPPLQGSNGPCTSHGDLPCPGEQTGAGSRVEPPYREHLANGHVTSRRTGLANGTGGRDDIEAVNGEVGGCSSSGSSSRESDYSPIWKYSCKVPNPNTGVGRGKVGMWSGSSTGEEAIYETVYPAEDYHTQDGEVETLPPSSPDPIRPYHSDEDSPPPLPPRTKSLMKSVGDCGHRPLERSMAVQLGLPPPFPTVVRKRPAPPPDTQGLATDQAGPSPTSVFNGNMEASVRPKTAGLSASSQSSCDSESSGASCHDHRRPPSAAETAFSYDIVDLDDILHGSDISYSHTDADSQGQPGQPSTQGPHSSLQSSSCASMESESWEDPPRPCLLPCPSEDPSGENEVVVDNGGGVVLCTTVAPLATPEQDSSLLQEAASTDTLLENSEEAFEPDVLNNCGGEKCQPPQDQAPIPPDSDTCDGYPASQRSFNSCVLPEMLNNQRNSLSSPVNVIYKCEALASAQERQSLVQGNTTRKHFDQVAHEVSDGNNEGFESNIGATAAGGAATVRRKTSESSQCDSQEQEVGTGIRISREGSVSGRSPCHTPPPPRLCDSLLQVSGSTSESVSPPSGSVTCSLSGEDGRRGSESTCMVVSTESSSSNSVFASPTNDLNVESLVSAALSLNMNIPSETHQIMTQEMHDSQDTMTHRGRDATPRQGSAGCEEEEDTPPAVPPHKPHHGLLKALVHAPVSLPSPSHHSKPQPPERTTSDRRERELGRGEDRRDAGRSEETWEREDSTKPHHPKLSRQPSLRDWLKRYPKVEVAFDEPLPSNVEARKDGHGRIFFIDHAAKTTSWEWPPPKPLLTHRPLFFVPPVDEAKRRSVCESGESECSGSHTSSRVVTPEPSTPPTSAAAVAAASVPLHPPSASCLSPDQSPGLVSNPPEPPSPPPPPPLHPALSPSYPGGEVSCSATLGVAANCVMAALGGAVEGPGEDSRRQEDLPECSEDEKAPTPPPRPHHRLSRPTPPLPPPITQQCPPTPTHHPRHTPHNLSIDQEGASGGNGGSERHGRTMRLPSIPERTIKFQRVEVQPGEEPLPLNWEARIDSHGRIFYIDHINRTTTWQRPSGNHSAQTQRNQSTDRLQRQQLDRR
ncbi:hypothetical protein Pmani_001142 [Petrolisthes manimaculis]|uniref:Protein kibra n=1 Tax=Petrolisthes manimaculis TaxID=1843537 RepID=A0AAE1QL51_9EUCA|nr:hypothetical protein Pmani_001142 [Petrolisthes manimaculis]